LYVQKKNLKSRVAFLAVLSLFAGVSQAKYKKAEAMMDVRKKAGDGRVGTTGTGQLTFNYKIPEADLVTLKEKYEGETVKRLYLVMHLCQVMRECRFCPLYLLSLLFRQERQ
jgi:hypothetical protein